MRKTKQAETVDEKMKDNEGEEKIKEKRKMVQKGSTNSITSLHRDAADGAVRLRGSRQANIRPTMHFFFLILHLICWFSHKEDRKTYLNLLKKKKKKGEKFFRGTLLVCVGLCTWHLRQ